jgi:hypothetical protein
MISSLIFFSIEESLGNQLIPFHRVDLLAMSQGS